MQIYPLLSLSCTSGLPHLKNDDEKDIQYRRPAFLVYLSSPTPSVLLFYHALFFLSLLRKLPSFDSHTRIPSFLFHSFAYMDGGVRMFERRYHVLVSKVVSRNSYW